MSATPKRRAMKVPINAATIPTTIVSQNGMACLPGATSFPTTPRMAPMMIAPMMLPIVMGST